MNVSRIAVVSVCAINLLALLALPVHAQIPAQIPAQTPAPNTVIYPGLPWRDTQGNRINAHGAGVLRVGATYYMVGEVRDSAISNHAVRSDPERFTSQYLGTNCYTSTDLVNWTFAGKVFDTRAGNGELGRTRIGERPKLVYNPITKRYLIFLHSGTWDYEDNHAVVLSSAQPCGQYRYERLLNLANGQPAPVGDLSVYQEGNRAYLLSADGFIYTLSDDYLRVTGTTTTGCDSCESPAMFMRDNTYYLIYSRKTWWASNDNVYYTAKSLTGPWKFAGVIAPEGTRTHHSQTTFVLPVQGARGTTFVFMADRWCERCLQHSTYFWQPIEFAGDGRISIPNYEAWSLDAANGTWQPVGFTGVVMDYLAGTTLAFTTTMSGTRMLLYGDVGDSYGLAAVSLCAASAADCAITDTIDLYAPNAANNVLVYASSPLPKGAFSLRVRPIGQRNHLSRGTQVLVKSVLMVDGWLGEPVPNPAQQPAPQAGPVVVPSATLPPACNRLPNGNFEAGNAGWSLDGSAVIVANGAQNGTHAAKLGPLDGSMVSRDIAVAAGGRVQVSGVYRTSGAVAWAGAGIDFIDVTGKEIGEVVQTLPAAQAYVPFVVDGRMPNGAVSARAWIAVDKTSMWVDDLSAATDRCE